MAPMEVCRKAVCIEADFLWAFRSESAYKIYIDMVLCALPRIAVQQCNTMVDAPWVRAAQIQLHRNLTSILIGKSNYLHTGMGETLNN